MNRGKQKSWFSSLKKTKLLCSECKKVERVEKYVKSGWVKLSCGHERNVKEISSDLWKVKEVVEELDQEKTSEFKDIGEVIWDWEDEH